MAFFLSSVCFSQQLPTSWVNAAEWNINPTVTCTLGGGTCTGNSNSYAATFGGLQQAICDWVAAADQQWLIKVPHGTLIQTNSTGYTCTQPGYSKVSQLTLYPKIVSSALPTKFFVIDSDTPLTYGQTVCAHGTTDATGTRQPPSGDISTWWTGGNNGCPNDIGSMWTLEGNFIPGNFGLVIQVAPWDAVTNLGPSHYVIRDVEVRPITSSTSSVNVIDTDVGAGGTSQTLQSQMASHIHFQNIYGHGDAKDWCNAATGIPGDPCQTSANTGGPGNNVITSMVHLANCVSCSLTYSYFDYIARPGSEGHIATIPESPGPVDISHNWMSGASIAFISGGISGADPFYFLYDLEFWQNRLTNPPSWAGSNYKGTSLVMKDRFELKTCKRCLIDSDIAEYQDTTGAQQGQCYSLNPRNCSAGVICDNPQVTIEDITLTNSICRHALTGVSGAARSGWSNSGGGVAGATRRVNISNNILYDLGNGPLYDPSTLVSSPFGMRWIAGGQTFICSGTNSSGTITLTCGSSVGLSTLNMQQNDPVIVTHCSDSTWNTPGDGVLAKTHGALAMAGTTGLTVIYSQPSAVSATATGCLVQNLQGSPYNLTFTHNTLVMDATFGGKNNARMYNGTTATITTNSTGLGSPSCTGPQFSVIPTAMSRTSNIVTATVPSVTGYTGNNQIIVEVAGSGDFNGTFYFDTFNSGAKTLSWFQTGANETASSLGTIDQVGSCAGADFFQNNTWKNNLFAINTTTTPSCPSTPGVGWTGWASSGGGFLEGCPSGTNNNSCSENILDSSNSTATYTDFPGRCGAKYQEVGGAKAGNNCAVAANCTLSFPAKTVCATGTADATCVGIKGMMNGVAFDGNDANYHNYALDPTSVYHNTADDGTDYGVNLTALDAAQSANLYTCATACGGGPFLDAAYSLTVTIVGSGTVTDNFGQISCPGDCVGFYFPLTPVVLTATPNPSNAFSGWSGSCAGTGTCSITINDNSTATATFVAVSTSGVSIGTGIQIDGTGGVKIVP